MNVIESFGLGKRYREAWALRDCTLAIPRGRIVALVGSNGAGKTTLLHCVIGLTRPSAGHIDVLDGLIAGSDEARERIAFVAQEAPLYRHLTVRSMLSMARDLNRNFDEAQAIARLSQLGIILNRKIGKLSGGQHSQLALALAFARHPDLLVLDEPLARLDPVARHDVMATIMASAAEEGLSVIFSSHVISELERVADYLILLSNGRVQLAGIIDEILAEHTLLSGPPGDAERIAREFPVVESRPAARQMQLLVQAARPGRLPVGWEAEGISLNELVLAYLRRPSATARPGPIALASQQLKGVTL